MGINVEVENLILLLHAIPADAVIWVSEQGCIIKLSFFCIKNLEESSVSASIFVQVLFMFQRAHFAQPVPDYIVSLFMLLCVEKFNERNLFVFETCRRELRSFASPIKINNVNFVVSDEISRCSATNLKPSTDIVTINLPNELKKTYDHINMGLYLVPQQNGVISKEDKIIIHD